VGGAPRIGDKADWVRRAAPGFDSLVRSAIAGHGGMPPRGGEADLTDDELRQAITYMFQTSVKPVAKSP
jgi:cytochrome c5